MPLGCGASGLIHATLTHPNWGVSGRAVVSAFAPGDRTAGSSLAWTPKAWCSTATQPGSSLEFSTLRRALSLMTASLTAFIFMARNQEPRRERRDSSRQVPVRGVHCLKTARFLKINYNKKIKGKKSSS